ncbi:hypothetical protein [uncultured Chryseobacterium sp.]|uniref:hypothetical protein n=1 Tax=uncultured Chryseobacterium sp. TaxID=259322 RepID=UPI002586ADF8|nr:hypothetical protein [uncultured Chryseobacterium sp.]
MNNIELLEKYKDYTITNIEDLILKMKLEDDLSMMQSTMLLVLKFKLTIKEADNYILNSQAWQDSKQSVEKFRNNIFDNISKLDN